MISVAPGSSLSRPSEPPRGPVRPGGTGGREKRKNGKMRNHAPIPRVFPVDTNNRIGQVHSRRVALRPEAKSRISIRRKDRRTLSPLVVCNDFPALTRQSSGTGVRYIWMRYPNQRYYRREGFCRFSRYLCYTFPSGRECRHGALLRRQRPRCATVWRGFCDRSNMDRTNHASPVVASSGPISSQEARPNVQAEGGQAPRLFLVLRRSSLHRLDAVSSQSGRRQ